MSARDYAVLSPVQADRLYSPGETIALDPAAATALVEAGVLCDPDDPRAATAGAEPADQAQAGIFEQALNALREAPPEQVREFLDRLAGDEEIRAKAASAIDRRVALVDAIGELEPGNEAHWTKGGKPEVRALAEATGLTGVTGAERDAAWAARQAAREAG